MVMLANTPAGDAYTYTEIESMAMDAGFTRVDSAKEIGFSRLVVAHA
jgi:hypothetical protein